MPEEESQPHITGCPMDSHHLERDSDPSGDDVNEPMKGSIVIPSPGTILIHESVRDWACLLLGTLQKQCENEKTRPTQTPQHQDDEEQHMEQAEALSSLVKHDTPPMGWRRHEDTMHDEGEGSDELNNGHHLDHTESPDGKQDECIPCSTVAIWTCLGTLLGCAMAYGVIAHFQKLKQECTNGGLDEDQKEFHCQDTVPAVSKDTQNLV